MDSKGSGTVAVGIQSETNMQGCSGPHINSQHYNPSITPTLRQGPFHSARECRVTNLTPEIGYQIPLNCFCLATTMPAVWTSVLSKRDRIPVVSGNQAGWKQHARQGGNSFDLEVLLHHQISCCGVCFNDSAKPKLIQSRCVLLIPCER
jgi:hypothetical protein